MSTPSLRARTVPEIIDAAFHILRAHYGTFVLLSVLAGLPMWIAFWLSGWYALAADPQRLVATGFGQLFTAPLIALFVVSAIWWSIVDGATISAASDAYLGNEVVPARALRHAMASWWRLPVARVLKVFALLFGYVLIVFPVLYVAARYFAVFPAVVLERRSVVQAFHRSRDLSQGAKWRIIGALTLAFLLYFVVGITLRSIVGLLPAPPAASALLGGIVYVFVFPLIGIVTTLLYYDMRIRKEAFDLEVLAQGLERQDSRNRIQAPGGRIQDAEDGPSTVPPTAVPES